MKGRNSLLMENESISISNKARHDKVVSLVERMLELPPLLSPQMPQRGASQGGRSGSPHTPGDKERVRRVSVRASGIIKIKPSADSAM